MAGRTQEEPDRLVEDALALEQWVAYCAALETCGLTLTRLDADLALRLAHHAQDAVGALAQLLDQPRLELAAFNKAGELFTYDADMEYDFNTPWYRPTRVCHVVSGAEFGWRNGAGKWPSFYPDSLPPDGGTLTLDLNAINGKNEFGPTTALPLIAVPGFPSGANLVVSLHWNTESDLDLHVITPNGTEIWSQKRSNGAFGPSTLALSPQRHKPSTPTLTTCPRP